MVESKTKAACGVRKDSVATGKNSTGGSTGYKSIGSKPNNGTPGLKANVKPVSSSKKLGVHTGLPSTNCKTSVPSNLKKKPSIDSNNIKVDGLGIKADVKMKKCVSQNVDPKSSKENYGTAKSNNMNMKEDLRQVRKDCLDEDTFSDINDDEIIMEGKGK